MSVVKKGLYLFLCNELVQAFVLKNKQTVINFWVLLVETQRIQLLITPKQHCYVHTKYCLNLSIAPLYFPLRRCEFVQTVISVDEQFLEKRGGLLQTEFPFNMM